MDKHFNELKEIRSMIDKASKNNFSTKLGDPEFEDGIFFLDKKYSKLPYHILLDESLRFETYNHPVCLWIINGELHNSDTDVIPVTISNSPKVYGDIPDYYPITKFVNDNAKLLYDLANCDITTTSFLDNMKTIDSVSDSSRLVVEMSVLGSEDTGLPVKIYVDNTMSYMSSGHSGSYRFKFQHDTDIKTPTDWKPVLIPTLEIPKDNGKFKTKIPKKSVNLVLKWGKLNLDILVQLGAGKIDFQKFRTLMVKVDGTKVFFSDNKIV